ncbi:MAG: response regulator [Sandaracinus sp.]
MQQKIVLLVEDNLATRTVVRSVLAAEGIRLVEATTLREAALAAEHSRPDLLLLDLGLPDGSALDVVGSLRARVGDQVPILAFTGLVSPADEARLSKAGFDDTVIKPVDPVRLRAVLRAYLPDDRPSPELPGRGKTVVVADDDPIQRKLGMLRVGKLGFRVLGAADGEECLALLEREPVDIVVSDVLMPRLDGYGLCERVRAQPRWNELRVVLVTNSYVDDADRELGLRLGADAYVLRSADYREVADALTSLVREPRARATKPVTGDVGATREARLLRTSHQLERQILLNSRLSQQVTSLAAQLTVLGSLTGALALDRSVDRALDSALHACLDAGGFSWGVLSVRRGERWTWRSLGLDPGERAAVETSPHDILDRIGASGDVRSAIPVAGHVLGIDGEALVVPIVHGDEMLGAVVLRQRETPDPQRVTFVQVVAGQVALVLALARSFDEVEATSERERERAELLATTFEAMGDPTLVFDAQGIATRWNEPGERYCFFGLWPETREAPKLMRADHPVALSPAEHPIARALAGEHVDAAQVCVERDGELRWLDVTVRPLRGPSGKPAGAVAVLRDVTDARRAQTQLIVSERLASVGVLAAGVAHEINNPLTSVLAEIELAMDELPESSPARERLAAALDAALRVRTIAADMRTLSRGSVGEDVRPVALERVLAAAVRIAAPQTRPVATVVVDAADAPIVRANEARLVQLFLNLLVNAAQAMAPSLDLRAREIRVIASADADGDARVAIADTGPGIPPEIRQHIFTPFFTTKSDGGGTGLGLPICQRIVREAGGTIECESTPGKGTTFIVRLPAARAG